MSDRAPQEQGLSSGDARAELVKLAQEDRAKERAEKQEEAKRHVDVRGVTHVTINKPHKAVAHNGELVIEIKDTAEATAATSSAPLLGFALIPDNSSGTKVRVLFGTVSPQLGSGLDTGVNAWPTGMTAGDSPPYLITIAAATEFYLVVGTNDDDPGDRKIYSVSVATRTGGAAVPNKSCYLGAANVVSGASVIVEGATGIGSQKVAVSGAQTAFWGSEPS